jgi:DNA helicase-2/ATP-dependent DNA helicase PcrA
MEEKKETRTKYNLNPEQLRAATHLNGPLLILAGAGSGKTRVLTNRIAWLIEEQGVAPWNIMAITFTNKAAREMKERVERVVGSWPEAVHVATFHSTCVRILRQYIDRIGYSRNFDIYDTDDTLKLMKDICRQMEINTKIFREKSLLARISHFKDELIDPEACRRDALALADERELLAANVYIEYQRRLLRCNALDFDDLICLTVKLFREHPDVLEHYQNRWKYLMVDEYQDTNKAQFVFISLLAQKLRNLCVVGDDDQSIYRFRGADIGNILNFEQIFPETQVIRLEQNYRSTQNILDAANCVIANNKGRKAKHLWTDRGAGEPVLVKRFDDGRSEAKYIVDDIARMKRKGIYAYRDSAVLYRTNAQSRAIEEQLLYENIPYTIIGGTNFYARREVKDILAYLRVISNSSDDIAVKRIINVPKRGIGLTSINRVDDYAHAHGMSFYDVARMADKVPGMGRGGLKIREIVRLIEDMIKREGSIGPTELIKVVMNRTGYEEELKLEGTDEAKDRLENLGELLNKAASYEASFKAGQDGAQPDSGPSLQGFLEEVSLVAEIDSFDADEDRAVLMTIHSAKGLEFPNVYMSGMDEGLFPSYQSTISEDPADMEEERRLCYVGITRAMDRLTLTGASVRMLRGQMQWYGESRFLEELPKAGGAQTPKGRQGAAHASAAKQNEAPRKKKTVPKPFLLNREPTPSLGTELGYGVGDTVLHVKFGQGIVQEIRDGGRDKEVTVDFEKFGVKKMFAGFAKLKKVE